MSRTAMVSDQVLQRLEEMIYRHRPGEKLPTELQLAQQLGVGRSTVRECLKALSAKKIIERRPDGTYVTDQLQDCLADPLNLMVNMEIGRVEDLVELREVLEVAAARLAAHRASQEDLMELERTNWLMQRPGITMDEMQQQDIAFHTAMARASGNPVLLDLLGAVRQVVANHVEDLQAIQPVQPESVQMHQGLIQAIQQRDGDLAAQRMQAYMALSRRGMRGLPDPTEEQKNQCAEERSEQPRNRNCMTFCVERSNPPWAARAPLASAMRRLRPRRLWEARCAASLPGWTGA